MKMIINMNGVKMSDIQLKSEIEHIIKKSGYSKSEKMLCSILRIISMRYNDVPLEQVFKVTKSIF